MTLAALARDDASARFFDAAAQGVLMYQRCSACGYAQLPIGGSVRDRCRNCGRNEAVWTADGTEPGPVIGLLELEEGPWMEAQLHALTGDAAQLAEGAPFAVAFETRAGSEATPVFIPR